MFTKPVPYVTFPENRTNAVECIINDDGTPGYRQFCVEDRFIPTSLEFEEQKLSNLIENGIEPKSLNIVSDRRLDDSEVTAFETYIIDTINKE